MKILRFSLFALLAIALISGCKKDEPDPWTAPDPVPGCMDPLSLSYNSAATVDDGSCQYPDNFFPIAVGNSWVLEGQVSIFTQTVSFTATFDMVGDTMINGLSYVISQEDIGAQGFPPQSNTYAYRRAAGGEVYRIDLADSAVVETKFLAYPLELNDQWYDTPEEDNFLCKVNSISNQSVAAGSFTNVIEVLYTQLDNGGTFSVFFAKDVGIVKVSTEFEVMGFPIAIEPELTSYNLETATIK